MIGYCTKFNIEVELGIECCICKEKKNRKFHNLKVCNYWTKDTDLSNMRFEVIDEEGRQYVRYGVDLRFSFQDDNDTLKIFVNKGN